MTEIIKCHSGDIVITTGPGVYIPKHPWLVIGFNPARRIVDRGKVAYLGCLIVVMVNLRYPPPKNILAGW